MEEQPIFTNAQEERIKELMRSSLEEFFTQKGKSLKGLLITIATVVGALAVIGGGMKTILAWLGFTYIK